MLHSKATAALMRLKEIDKKYKMRKEGRYTMSSSTESTLSSPSVEHSIGDHKKLNNLEIPLKSKLDVRMPKTHIEEEEEEEDRSHLSTKEKVSSTIVINVETKSSENVEEEFSNNASSSMIETDENTSKKIEEEEVSKNYEEKSVEIEEKRATSSEEVVKTKTEEAEITGKVSDVDTASSISKISSEIEELESPVGEHPMSYVNDTFEEASSSTLSTMKSRDDLRQIDESLKLKEEANVEDSMRCGVKKIDILLNKSFAVEQKGEKSNEKQIVELVPPKLMENTSECEIDLDKELSNYVKTIENIDEDVSDITPVRLLRPPKQLDSFSKGRGRKYKRRPITTKDDSARNHSQSDKTTTESLTTSKNNRRSVEHDSFSPINDTEIMEKVHDEISSMYEKPSFDKNEQRSIENKTKKLPDEKEDSMKNKTPVMSCNNNRPRTAKNPRTQSKKKKKKTKARTSHKSDKVMDFNEDKFLRFDVKQIHRLRKQISKLAAGLRLNDDSSSTNLEPILFKPLDFPTIANYTCPDMDTLKLTKQNPYIELQDRLAMIRQWLKDQYIFYRLRSNLVEMINEKYVPMSLEDAKMVIRELQKSTVEAR
ncbi:hypothetical protein KPH14_005319 [Odynerus spinipes]|uniref:Uncharacterized protein n=1 Tax=Odynerus spinipes TaxID=1348599 RepID=A0AAD9RBG9_9HYME|nr:hypothetical protein KPH14_005319 [Odynerus spinipes]